MKHRQWARRLACGALLLVGFAANRVHADAPSLRVEWKDNYLTIEGSALPGGAMKVLYIEAYCRPGSAKRKWELTTIGHKTRVVSADGDGRRLVLECILNDGVKVRHEITAGADEIDFQLIATNPTGKASLAHWAQPCIRVDAFTGRDKVAYLDKCFIFLGGRLVRMPTPQWAKEALYTPGQVWSPAGVDRADINPRPLSDDVPGNGLIGCYSADEKMIFAVAFEPYQELFQGIAACLHSDFRIGGLKPGETKRLRGKIYFVPADVEALLKRYRRDFPEHGPARADAAQSARTGRWNRPAPRWQHYLKGPVVGSPTSAVRPRTFFSGGSASAVRGRHAAGSSERAM